MLNMSILWKKGNLGYILHVTPEDEGCITPAVCDAVYGFHYGCIEYLLNTVLVTIPVGYSFNTAPIGVVDQNLSGSSCFLDRKSVV